MSGRLQFGVGRIGALLPLSLLAAAVVAVLAISFVWVPSAATGEGLLFQAEQRYAAHWNPHSVAVADLDGDGAPDLVTANAYSDDVSVLLGNGDGSFQAQQRFAAGPWPCWPSSVAVTCRR